jgi:coenzyme PQQ precursor peptide PqqA
MSHSHDLRIPTFGLNPYNRRQESANCLHLLHFTTNRETAVKNKIWTRPEFKEVSLGCEINCYAPAEI